MGGESSAETVDYSAHTLRTEDDGIRKIFAERYTALRIKGLKQSPDSFSATLEGESALNGGERLARISVPNKDVVVVVASRRQETRGAWWEREWVAQATVWGPHSWEEHVAPFRHTHDGPDRRLSDEQIDGTTQVADADDRAATLFFHMTALYVDAEHRKRGLARLLCEFTFDLIAKTTRPLARHAELRIVIKPTNVIVVKMYEQMGFKSIVGARSTLAEATYAAGDQSSLPDDYDRSDAYTSRKGLIMVKGIVIV